MRYYKTPAKNWQTRKDARLTQNKLQNGLREYRRQWHECLPSATLNYSTTYQSSIGCESSKVFYGSITHNVLDHKLGNNPDKKFLPTTEFAEVVQQRMQILINQTKKTIMQSYQKYNDYYDRKAEAAPPKEKEYCFILQPKADSQASKTPFREIFQKVLSSDKYNVRRVNTNKTQVLKPCKTQKICAKNN